MLGTISRGVAIFMLVFGLLALGVSVAGLIIEPTGWLWFSLVLGVLLTIRGVIGLVRDETASRG
jgi:uncharacterized membrane protein